MSKRMSAKYKLDRRMGENIWGRPKSPINQRSYGPGQHGQRRKNKVSDFGLQLRAKQKLKGYYANLTEKQFSRTYKFHSSGLFRFYVSFTGDKSNAAAQSRAVYVRALPTATHPDPTGSGGATPAGGAASG